MDAVARSLSTSPKKVASPALVRCAVYTRKSTSVGLNQDFNSLDAQRGACLEYIARREHDGWQALAEAYEDGGFTGANLDRPGMQRLLADADAGLIDVVVVYKVDRLSRSLLDFARLMARFQESDTAFVSVTQNFSTADAMGRLTLNMLMSFAEFEREMISERTRDKMGAARRRGKWTGGLVPLGYRAVEKKLVVDEDEAAVVREVFDLYIELGSAMRVAQKLNNLGRPKRARSHKGVTTVHPWSHANVLGILKHPIYVGLVRAGDETFPGEHTAIVAEERFEQANAILGGRLRPTAPQVRSDEYLLAGLLRCAHCGGALTPVSTSPHGKRYRYYRCVTIDKFGRHACPAGQLRAEAIEEFVVDRLRETAADLAAARAGKTDWLTLTLRSFDETWPHLTWLNRNRLVRALVDRVEVDQVKGEMTIDLADAGAVTDLPEVGS
ncbi:MAG: recombinase family protein [Deltaproteobacteria bacterium]|nr:recombinase family protein [Deltaproteobacteria bacterium]